MEMLICALCVALIIFGVGELTRLIVFHAMKPKDTGRFTVVATPESAEDCEYVVRSAAERMKWLKLDSGGTLLCLNIEGDEEIDKICKLLSLEYPYLKVSKTDELVYDIIMSTKEGKE